MLKTKRLIFAEDLRQACVENMWYTSGSGRDYDNLLEMCDEELTDELLEEMAKDIVEHSDFKYQDVKSIAYHIINKVARYSVEVVE